MNDDDGDDDVDKDVDRRGVRIRSFPLDFATRDRERQRDAVWQREIVVIAKMCTLAGSRTTGVPGIAQDAFNGTRTSKSKNPNAKHEWEL